MTDPTPEPAPKRKRGNFLTSATHPTAPPHCDAATSWTVLGALKVAFTN